MILEFVFNILNLGPWNDGLIMGFVSKQKAEETPLEEIDFDDVEDCEACKL